MISETLVSCGYLLLGAGWCIKRLVNHSNEKFSKVLPQFVIASIGVAAIGARSLYALIYDIFCHNYPIDPRLMAREMRNFERRKNFVDWTLSRGGTAIFIYSFYYHYDYPLTGMFLVIGLTTLEASLSISGEDPTEQQMTMVFEPVGRFWQRFSTIMRQESYPLATFWILSHELLGRATENHYCRLANVPYVITVWSFPPERFEQGWSIMHSINDYTMLCYIILMTEGLCT